VHFLGFVWGFFHHRNPNPQTRIKSCAMGSV
jgi:hypothetical protein